ncbi:MAG TPA: ThuA domain-containing protein [Opitutaceae bacterium]|nr:ThuA domain-containing protein [Opitutaceae bacterium]
MKSPLFAFLLAALCAATAHAASPAKPVRALLITGGCCHDYKTQAQLLTDGMKAIAPVEWTIVNDGGTTTRAMIPLYDKPDWAKGYDVVVHNECFADTTDENYIRKITAAHKGGTPAVVIHCAMHTYRAATVDDWREFLGVTSRRHDHQSAYPVRRVAADHPIMRGFPAVWTTPMDELYVIEKLWPGAKALAVSTSERDGKEYAAVWTNDYHGTRIFGTTFGHGLATWRDPVYVAMVARGVLWAAGRE